MQQMHGRQADQNTHVLRLAYTTACFPTHTCMKPEGSDQEQLAHITSTVSVVLHHDAAAARGRRRRGGCRPRGLLGRRHLAVLHPLHLPLQHHDLLLRLLALFHHLVLGLACFSFVFGWVGLL